MNFISTIDHNNNKNNNRQKFEIGDKIKLTIILMESDHFSFLDFWILPGSFHLSTGLFYLHLDRLSNIPSAG